VWLDTTVPSMSLGDRVKTALVVKGSDAEGPET
jgi:hypothetical protein